MEKQDLSDPRNQDSPSWPEVPVILAGSFQHCRRQVCIPCFFLLFFLPLSTFLWRSEVLAETLKAT